MSEQKKKQKCTFREILGMGPKTPVATGPSAEDLKSMLQRPCIGEEIKIVIDHQNDNIPDETKTVKIDGLHRCENNLWLIEEGDCKIVYSPGMYFAHATEVR